MVVVVVEDVVDVVVVVLCVVVVEVVDVDVVDVVVCSDAFLSMLVGTSMTSGCVVVVVDVVDVVVVAGFRLVDVVLSTIAAWESPCWFKSITASSSVAERQPHRRAARATHQMTFIDTD
jgi:hypothetical protein